MKRILWIASLLCSFFCYQTVSAAPPPKAWVAPFQVGVPNYPAGLEMTLTGLYLQPTSKVSDYATQTIPASSFNDQTYNIFSSDYKYSPGIIFGLGYIFPNSGNDVQATFTYFKSSADTYNIPASGAFINPLTTELIPNLNFNEASDTSTFTFNVVDLTGGQFLSIGKNLLSRIYGGLRFVNAKREDFVHMDRSTLQDTLFLNQNPKVDILGIGPRMGIDTTYRFYKAFGVTGRAAVFALVTQQKTEANITVDTPITIPRYIFVNLQDDVETIWGYEYRIGLNVTIPLKKDSLMRFELGEAVTTTRTSSAGGLNGLFLNMFVKV